MHKNAPDCINHLRGYNSRNIPTFKKCVYYKILPEYTKVLILRFKYILYDYFESCLIFKTRLLKIAKPPVLRTCGNNNSNSRYGNDLKFVMAFLDR